jgi:hypothetical protein
MKIKLPKSLKGLKFDLLFTIDMNDFDVEMLLPSLFHLVRTKGLRVGKSMDPDLYAIHRSKLAEHPRMNGFTPQPGQLLDRWLRTAVVKMGWKGRDHSAEQMSYLYPTTMLAYKAGLPKDSGRLRGVHNFVYSVLLTETKRDARRLDEVFRAAIGKGLIFHIDKDYDCQYDGYSEIDIEALLTCCFLEGQSAGGVRALEVKPFPRLANQSHYFAADVLNTLGAYNTLPSTVLGQFLLTLINFHLFVYFMRLMSWVESLLSGVSPKQPDIYLDCAGERGTYSDELARSCVERDLEGLERYVRSSLRLRTLDRFVSSNPKQKNTFTNPENNIGEYFKQLIDRSSDIYVETRAEYEFSQVCEENGFKISESPEEAEITDAVQYLQALQMNTDLTAFDRLVSVLFESQRDFGLKNISGWFYSIAGFNRSYGLMTGNRKGRFRVARYVLSNELLNALVHAALADFGTVEDGHTVPATRIQLREFLEWLLNRFGMLIDRPPSFDSSTEAIEASRRNLEAFKVRLRQIGVFQNLSDDFDAQYIGRSMSVPGR